MTGTTRLLGYGIVAVVVIGVTASCRGGVSHKPPIHVVQDMDFQAKLKAQSESTFSRWSDHRGMREPVVGTLSRGGIPAGSEPGDYYMPSTDLVFASFDTDRNGRLDRIECRDLPFQRKGLFVVADRNRDSALDKSEVTAAAKLFDYKSASGSYVAENPLPATREVLERGRQRFNIHCAVCHGQSGKGGAVAARWPVPVPDLVAHEDPTTRVRLIGLPFGELFETITKGKGTMPGYTQQIHVEDRWAIAHYLKALQQNFN